jgi:membrane protease YdiL (CAAX protease family)
MMPPDASDRRALALRGAAAAVVWTAIEYALRVPCAGLLLRVLWRAGIARSPAGRLAVDAWLLVPVMGALAAVFLRLARRDNLTWSALGYQGDRRRLAAGVLGGVAVIMASMLTSIVDASLVSPPDGRAAFGIALGSAGAPALAALMLGNGVLAPIVEEFAWRGYIQTRFARAWGPVPAILATSALFALKHVLVDWSLTRVASLIAAALALGIIGRRYGTTASTASHLTMNFAATAGIIIAARVD